MNSPQLLYLTYTKGQKHTSNVVNFEVWDIGYPQDGRADNAAYRHDRRADKRRYPHDREIDIQMLNMFRN